MKCSAALPSAAEPPTAINKLLGVHAMHAALCKPLLTAQLAACTPCKKSYLSTLRNECEGLQNTLQEVHHILACTIMEGPTEYS